MSIKAARLDHRDLNRDLRVFATDPLAGAGLPLWLPDGAVIRDELHALARDLARADGCQGVYSPVLGKRALYERSGHWAKFSEDMFPPMAVGGDELVLRPANCPHHALIYASAQRSWRELPVRLNEFAAMFHADAQACCPGSAGYGRSTSTTPTCSAAPTRSPARRPAGCSRRCAPRRSSGCRLTTSGCRCATKPRLPRHRRPVAGRRGRAARRRRGGRAHRARAVPGRRARRGRVLRAQA